MTLATGTLQKTAYNDQFAVVLVEPAESLNVGSVARAMSNLGFSDLRLVDPKKWSRSRADITACWGRDLLDTVKVYATYQEALGDVEEVVCFTVREGKNRSALMVVDEWVEQEIATPPKKTALVFGPEDSGLRQEHTEQARCLVRIPSTEPCRAYNLAQSVLIALYEVSHRTWGEAVLRPEKEAPTWNDMYQLDTVVDRVLRRTGYYRSGIPEPIPGLVKMMFRRMKPDSREARVLLGMFARIDKVLTGDIPLTKIEDSVDSVNNTGDNEGPL
jgi:tRNA/rRNA methyltransferase